MVEQHEVDYDIEPEIYPVSGRSGGFAGVAGRCE